MVKNNNTIINSAGEKCKTAKYNMNSTLKQIAIKCYEEQLPNGGFEKLKETINGIDVKHMSVLAILHNKCPKRTDNIWLSELEKPHVHIICVVNDTKQYKVQQFLKELGIVYRQGQDDNLFKNHGVEAVRNLANYSMYLTHETEQAQIDGKYQYDITDIVSNLSIKEIQNIRNGYAKVSNKATSVNMTELGSIDDEAYSIGYNLQDFSEWYSSLSFTIRSHAKMKTIKESYFRGVEARLEDKDKCIIPRLCVFIQGEPGCGKTVTSEKALSGKKIVSVGGQGTGKFDDVTISTEAIIIDDDICPNLLNICDNKICKVYRRNGNNPYWCGHYFIVTSNLLFEDWIDECGNFSEKQKIALHDRFWITHIEETDGHNHLIIDKISDRGNGEMQDARIKMARDFFNRFNEIMYNYVKDNEKRDYSEFFNINSSIERNEKEKKADNIDMNTLREKFLDFYVNMRLNSSTEPPTKLFELFLELFPQYEYAREALKIICLDDTHIGLCEYCYKDKLFDHIEELYLPLYQLLSQIGKDKKEIDELFIRTYPLYEKDRAMLENILLF